MSNYKELSPRRFAVLIDEKTIMGLRALAYFMQQIPFEKRRKMMPCSYAWDGDETDENGKRWGIIQVVPM